LFNNTVSIEFLHIALGYELSICMNRWKPQFQFGVSLISEIRKRECDVIWVWAVCMATYSSMTVVPIRPMSVTMHKKKRGLRKGIWNGWYILAEFHNL